MEPMTARERLRSQVLDRISGMVVEEAVAWVVGHGLLSVAGDGRLEPAVRGLLERRRREVAVHNLFLVHRFREVVDALGDVPVCPLKGIVLLDTVYRDDPESRPLGDVDLLVPAERVEEVVRRLEGLGLEEIPVSRRIRNVSPERVLADGRCTVEIHGRLGFKHGGHSRWEDVEPEPAEVHGRKVFALDDETTLVHLVSHFVKHRPLSRLVWSEDILRWIERGVDGVRVMDRARALGSSRSVIAGVRVLRHTLGSIGLPEVPSRPSGPLASLAVRLNERLVWRDLGTAPWHAGPGRAPGRTLSALLLADRLRDRARLLRVKAAEVVLR